MKNIVVKKGTLGKKNIFSRGIILVILCTFFTSGGQILWKIGSKNTSSLLAIVNNLPLIAGCVLYGLGSLLLIEALKHEDLSLIYPIIALSFIWVNIASILIFGEIISLANWGGIACIIVGISFIGYGSRQKG